MSNGVVEYKWQRSQERIFRVGVGCRFDPSILANPIQDAIDAADTFLGGAGSSANRATVVIHNNGAPYTVPGDIINLKPSVDIRSAGSFDGKFLEHVHINASFQFTPTIASARVVIRGLRVQPPTNLPALLLAGALSSSRIISIECFYYQANASTEPVIDNASTGGGFPRIRFYNCSVERDSDGFLLRTDAGLIQFWGSSSIVTFFTSSDVQIGEINGAGGLIAFTNVDTIEASSPNPLFVINGGGSASVRLNNVANFRQFGVGIRFQINNAAAFVECKNVQDNTDSASLLCDGVAGANFSYSNYKIAGDSNTVVAVGANVLPLESPNNRVGRNNNIFFVGDQGVAQGRGYVTIQAAVDAAIAAGYGANGSKGENALIYCSGFFNENIIIPDTGIHLIGKDYDVTGAPRFLNNGPYANNNGSLEIQCPGPIVGDTVIENFSLKATSGSGLTPVIISGVNLLFSQIKFLRCLISQEDDLQINAKTVDVQLSHIDLRFRQCLFANNSITGIIFNAIDNMFLRVWDLHDFYNNNPNSVELLSSPGPLANQRVLVCRDNCDIFFINSEIRSGLHRIVSGEIFRIGRNNKLEFRHCRLQAEELFSGAFIRSESFPVNLIKFRTSTINIVSPNKNASLSVASGEQSTATIEVIDNTFDGGDAINIHRQSTKNFTFISNAIGVADTINVNGKTIVPTVDFAIGGTINDTAQNFVDFINASGDILISGIVVAYKGTVDPITGFVEVVIEAVAIGTLGDGLVVSPALLNNRYHIFGATLTGKGVDSVSLVFGVDWFAGATTALSAVNLADAIENLNLELGTQIDDLNLSLIHLISQDGGLRTRAWKISETDGATDNFTLSGAQLLGGENGQETKVEFLQSAFENSSSNNINKMGSNINLISGIETPATI